MVAVKVPVPATSPDTSITTLPAASAVPVDAETPFTEDTRPAVPTYLTDTEASSTAFPKASLTVAVTRLDSPGANDNVEASKVIVRVAAARTVQDVVAVLPPEVAVTVAVPMRSPQK